MKWKEMTTTQKVVHCVGLFCCIAYCIMAFLKIFDVWDIPDSVRHPIFATFLLLQGYLQRIRKYAIIFYALAGAYFLHGISYLF